MSTSRLSDAGMPAKERGNTFLGCNSHRIRLAGAAVSNGYTIVELVVVLVLIGILAVFAVPRFLNLSTQSNQTATTALAASLGTTSASNYARRSANSSQGSAVSNCTDIGPLLPGGLPPGYSIVSLAISAAASATCTLNGLSGTTATFVGYGVA